MTCVCSVLLRVWVIYAWTDRRQLGRIRYPNPYPQSSLSVSDWDSSKTVLSSFTMYKQASNKIWHKYVLHYYSALAALSLKCLVSIMKKCIATFVLCYRSISGTQSQPYTLYTRLWSLHIRSQGLKSSCILRQQLQTATRLWDRPRAASDVCIQQVTIILFTFSIVHSSSMLLHINISDIFFAAKMAVFNFSCF